MYVMYVCIFIKLYVCRYVCTYVGMYVCNMYVCMSVYLLSCA